MENSSQHEELIVKYLSNDLSDEERAFVLEWINSNEQVRKYFDELKNTWRLAALKDSLKAINVESELRRLEQKISITDIENNLVPAVESSEDEKSREKSTFYKLIIPAAVAASVLLVMVLSGGLFNDSSDKNKKAVTFETKSKDTIVQSRTRHEINTSGRLRKFLLPDGTAVTLSDKSEISFQDPLNGNRRDITLIGKAYFNITKDETRPFTVFSGGLSTTALGTKFNVTAFAKEKFITVRLYEGKVVVKINYNLSKTLQKDFYLLPSQELVYSKQQATANVRSFNENLVNANNADINGLTDDTLSVPSNVTGSWFMFNNQLLENVFVQLENMYHVEIEFSKKDVQNLYFIARFERGYPLDKILNQIALLNHLKITKKNNKYIVSK